MRIRNFKILIVVLFMGVFVLKMAISLAPVFLYLDNKTVSAVILQLEQETKTEKDTPDKDTFKEKKVFDEYDLHSVAFLTFVVETNVLHNLEHNLYKQVYHPVVPTPPPNV
ncbi:hypothetical protein [Mucilaginibacter pocheonensis]|uniref:Uncharacterized protein n=1 Tax=Mucilaginibacter pocheonensis TaxID=398050 RepID=A0ABU1TIF4_9SPHI|nr:hypothetical protein [Mucilaginibacter pocheonensis]MDR6945186.1 hypothetical protein [Mucilaginibacter pocheonensis]